MRAILLLFVLSVAGFPAWAGGIIEYKSDLTLEINKYGEGRFDASLTQKASTRFEKSDLKRIQPFQLEVPYYGSRYTFKAELNNWSVNSGSIRKYTEDSSDSFLSDGIKIFVESPEEVANQQNEFSYELTYHISDSGFIPMVVVPKRYDRVLFSYTVIHPANMDVSFNITPLVDSLKWEVVRKNDKKVQLIIHARNLSAEARVEWPFNNQLAFIHTELTANGRPVNPVTPRAFTKWYLTGLKKRTTDDPRNTDQMDSLSRWIGFKEDTLKSAYEFITTKVRYMADISGGHSHYPHSISHIIRRGYGDCKDKAWLLYNAGRLTGKKVFLALVNTDPMPPLKSVSVNQFNHMINAVLNEDGSYQFIDGTARHLRYGQIPGSLEGKQVLVLNPDKPETVTVPYNDSSSSLSFSFTGHIDSLKSVPGTVLLGSEYQRRVKLLMETKQMRDSPDLVGFILDKPLRSLTFSNLKIQDSLDKPIALQANLSSILVQSKTKTYYPVNQFTVFDVGIADRIKDSLDLFLSVPSSISITYHLIDPYQSMAMKDSVSIVNEIFTFHARIQSGNGRVSLNQEIRFRKDHVPVAQKQEFLAATNQFFKLRKRLFTQQRILP